jgi:hypothetical protein
MEVRHKYLFNAFSTVLIIVIIFPLTLMGCATAGSSLDIADNGPAGVFESAGVIHSKGYGVSRKDDPPGARVLTAREAAYNMALGNMIEFIEGAQINTQTTMKDGALGEQVFQKSVKGSVKKVTILKEGVVREIKDQVIYFVELSVKTEDIKKSEETKEPISVEIEPSSNFQPVRPDRYSTFNVIRGDIPVNISLKEVESLLEELRQKNEDVGELQKELEAYKKAQLEPSEPTGIILNAQNIPIKEGAYVKIYYRSGDDFKLVYGDEARDRPKSSDTLMSWADWEYTMTAAMNNERVQPNPIVVDVIGIYLADKDSEPVISAEDAVRIEKAERKYKLLERGKVVFLTTNPENRID